jgi:hypothetical protein
LEELKSAMIEAFTSLEKVAKGMNLLINQEKTKYMPVTKQSHASYPHYLEVGPYKFQVVHSLTYLGSDINCNNDIGAEIQKRILAVNIFSRTEKASEVPLDLKKH